MVPDSVAAPHPAGVPESAGMLEPAKVLHPAGMLDPAGVLEPAKVLRPAGARESAGVAGPAGVAEAVVVPHCIGALDFPGAHSRSGPAHRDDIAGGVPTPPEAARVIFGAALPTAVAYARMLAGPGVERGLIGPSEAARIWDRHLLNSAAVAELVPADCEIADLGSGAGLPGIVLAILRPGAHVVLVEPMARRTAFLAECVERLGLTNVTVRRSRAEDLAGQIEADLVTARAVARLDKLAGLAAGLAHPGGTVLAIKGAAALAELDRARSVLDGLGAWGAEVVMVGSGVLAEPTTVVRFRTSERPRNRKGAPRARRDDSTGRQRR